MFSKTDVFDVNKHTAKNANFAFTQNSYLQSYQPSDSDDVVAMFANSSSGRRRQYKAAARILKLVVQLVRFETRF